jgi:hypothetical protein
LEDPRNGNAAQHDFHELLLIALCAVLCDGQGAVREREGGTLHDDCPAAAGRPAVEGHDLRSGRRGRSRACGNPQSDGSTDISWLQKQHAWPGMAAIGEVLRKL